MHFDRVGLELCEQRGEIVEPHPMIGGFDQSKGTGRQTTATAVATTRVNTGTGVNGIGRTDPLAGPRTVRGTEGRVKDSLAEMSIATIADADHQPGSVTGAFPRPAETRASGIHHSGIGCHINTLNTCNRIQRAEISNRSEVLIAGPADQLDPTTLAKGLITGRQ